jgi:hypothetical protein
LLELDIDGTVFSFNHFFFQHFPIQN